MDSQNKPTSKIVLAVGLLFCFVIASFTSLMVYDRFVIGSSVTGESPRLIYLSGMPGMIVNLGYTFIVLYAVAYFSYLVFRSNWLLVASHSSGYLSCILLAVGYTSPDQYEKLTA